MPAKRRKEKKKHYSAKAVIFFGLLYTYTCPHLYRDTHTHTHTQTLFVLKIKFTQWLQKTNGTPLINMYKRTYLQILGYMNIKTITVSMKINVIERVFIYAIQILI